jgi:Uma2 family endonuclease
VTEGNLIVANDPVRARYWTRREYDRLIERGFFGEDDRVELLGGQLMVAEPQGSRHAATVSLVADALRTAFGQGWYVTVQLPLALDDQSEPEPDVAVVRGTARDYRDAHPSRPILVVEVAESSGTLDRRHKASLYARALVPDYWIVDLNDESVEVHRRPVSRTRHRGRPRGRSHQPDRRRRPPALSQPRAWIAPPATPG